jgi:hypothetical protein
VFQDALRVATQPAPHVAAPPLGQPRAGLFLKAAGGSMTTDERRLLNLLASADEGCTDALLLARGFALADIFNVVKAGLATARAERLHAASPPIEIMRITDSGRRALAKPPG